MLSRRRFLQFCNVSAAAVGLDAIQLGLLQKALANPAGPTVAWLQGSSCTGCSVSLLNYISDKAGEPATITEVLAEHIDLIFHPTLMASAGETAAAALRRLLNGGAFILVVEGAAPTAFGGYPCVVYSYHGEEVTFQRALQELAGRAAQIVCVGTCASFGGIPASGSNPTGAMSVRALTGRPTINISGCPANPNWVVWALVQLILGRAVTLDADGRPTALYSVNYAGTNAPALIHDKCPRSPDHHGVPLAVSFGENGRCLQNLGCRGPATKSRCEAAWNGVPGAGSPQAHPGHWCIGVNAPCHGCVEKTFPGPQSFYQPYGG